MRSTNSTGDQPATSSVNGRASTASAPACSRSAARSTIVVSVVRGVVGPQHRHRVRVEGDRDDRESALVGDGPGPGDHPTVAEVHAVEVPDHHDRAAEVGRHVVGGPPDLHGRNTIGRRRLTDEDGDGAGPAVARLVEREELARRGEHRGQPGAGRGRAPGRTGRRVACSSSRSTEGKPRARGRRRSAAPRSRSASWSRVRATAEVERADRGPAQRGEVAADAERGAEVAGDGADVGAAGAAHREVEVDTSSPANVAHDELVDRDAARRELDLLARRAPARRRACRRP